MVVQNEGTSGPRADRTPLAFPLAVPATHRDDIHNQIPRSAVSDSFPPASSATQALTDRTLLHQVPLKK